MSKIPLHIEIYQHRESRLTRPYRFTALIMNIQDYGVSLLSTDYALIPVYMARNFLTLRSLSPAKVCDADLCHVEVYLVNTSS